MIMDTKGESGYLFVQRARNNIGSPVDIGVPSTFEREVVTVIDAAVEFGVRRPPPITIDD